MYQKVGLHRFQISIIFFHCTTVSKALFWRRMILMDWIIWSKVFIQRNLWETSILASESWWTDRRNCESGCCSSRNTYCSLSDSCVVSFSCKYYKGIKGINYRAKSKIKQMHQGQNELSKSSLPSQSWWTNDVHNQLKKWTSIFGDSVPALNSTKSLCSELTSCFFLFNS